MGVCEWKLMCVSASEGALSKRPFSSLKPPVSVFFFIAAASAAWPPRCSHFFSRQDSAGIMCTVVAIVKNGIHRQSGLIYRIFCAAAISLGFSSECTQPATWEILPIFFCRHVKLTCGSMKSVFPPHIQLFNWNFPISATYTFRVCFPCLFVFYTRAQCYVDRICNTEYLLIHGSLVVIAPLCILG